MKVSRLIRELEKLDPDLEVCNYFTGKKLKGLRIEKTLFAAKKMKAKVWLVFEWF